MDLNKKHLLLPLSGVFFIVSVLRKWLYKIGVFKVHDFSTAIIVVGNITVGGTGKTPIVIALANHFKQQGKKVGVVSRGYGGKYKGKQSQLVDKQSAVKQVGDEPVLIAYLTKVPVMVNKNRPQAIKDLIDNYDVDLIISDDGLQHYAMGRNVEICVHNYNDNDNEFLLPAGRLRETKKRLNSVDFVLQSNLKPVEFINALSAKTQPLDYFAQQMVHAVAGIGRPQRFFDTLTELGVQTIPHVFADHYAYRQKDLVFESDYPIIMTAKDCVKCQSFATEQMWYLQVEAQLSDDFLTKLNKKL